MLCNKKDIVKVAGLLDGLLLHMGQNAGLRYAMADTPEKLRKLDMKLVPRLFLRGALRPGRGMPTATQDFGYGALRGAVPEFGIILNHGEELGLKVRRNLERFGIDPESLSKRDWVVLSRLINGDLKAAYNANTPNARKLSTAVLDALIPGFPEKLKNSGSMRNMLNSYGAYASRNPAEASREMFNGIKRRIKKTSDFGKNLVENGYDIKENVKRVGRMARKDVDDFTDAFGHLSKEDIDTFLDTLGTEIKNNRLLGPLGRNFAEKGRRAELINWASQGGEFTKNKQRARLVGDMLSSGAISVADWPAEAFAAIKRVGDWKEGKNFRLSNFSDNKLTRAIDEKVPVRKGLEWANKNIEDIFGNIPNEIGFERGLNGGKVNLANFDKQTIQDIKNAKNENRLSNQLLDYARDAWDTNIISPLTASAHDMSEGVGRALHSVGINQNKLDMAKNIAKRHNLVSPEEPPTAYRRLFTKVRNGFDTAVNKYYNTKKFLKNNVNFSKPEFTINNPF